MKYWTDNTLLYCWMTERHLGTTPLEAAAFARYWHPTGDGFHFGIKDVMTRLQLGGVTAGCYMDDFTASEVFRQVGRFHWVMDHDYRAELLEFIDDAERDMGHMRVPLLANNALLLSQRLNQSVLDDLFGTTPGDVANLAGLDVGEALARVGVFHRYQVLAFVGSVPVREACDLALMGQVAVRFDVTTGRTVLPSAAVQSLLGDETDVQERLQDLHTQGLWAVEATGDQVSFTVTPLGVASLGNYLIHHAGTDTERPVWKYGK